MVLLDLERLPLTPSLPGAGEAGERKRRSPAIHPLEPNHPGKSTPRVKRKPEFQTLPRIICPQEYGVFFQAIRDTCPRGQAALSLLPAGSGPWAVSVCAGLGEVHPLLVDTAEPPGRAE